MRFGPFVFDPVSGELTGATGVNRLPPQVGSVLRILTERAGEVVTRAELRDALWPDTTVEFDQGLNFCVRQLRIALDDDADHPRFIETLPRRGYRFIAPVENGASAPAPPVVVPRRRRVVAAAALVTIVVGGGLVLATRVARPPRADASMAVIAFDVPPRDSMLAGYSARLAETIVAAITRAHANDIAVMGPSFTKRFPGTSTPPDSVRAALHATHLLSGTLSRADGGIRVFAQMIRLNDRRHLMGVRLVDSTATGARLELIGDSIAHRASNITIGAAGR